MKKIFFPAMAAMALGLASCSSDDVTPNGGGPVDFSKGGYVKLSINLPSASQSRAVTNSENDQFDDGMASEYSVKNAQLILFSGTDEATATFHSAYDLSTSFNMDGNTDQITSTTRVVKQTTDNGGNGKVLYALVVLNNNGETIVETGNKLTVGGQDFTGTFTDFKNQLSTTTTGTCKFASNVATNGIFMTNAPLASAPGGSTEPTNTTNITTLTDVTNSVYNTEAEALSKPAAKVYVERGVAKVTMQSYKGNKTLSGPEFQGKDVSFEVVGWALDVTNKSSYLVRHVNSAWNTLHSDLVSTTGINTYRFIGSSVVENGLYRTYWAEDPNYSTNPADAFTIQPANFNEYSDKFDDENPQYCYENTFNVDNQRQDRTTRALVKVQLTLKNGTKGEDLYTLNQNRSELYSLDNLKDRIATAVAHAQGKQSVTITDNSNITFEAEDADKSTYKVKDITTTDGTVSSEEVAYVNNEIGLITKYDNGYAYYPVRIKHFGDSATPWKSDNTGVSANDVYNGNNDNQYLGRYGVVRNNWYDLSVTGISGVGTPRTPDTSEDYDDELSSYISVRINILSWAKRHQDAEL